jgi:uncharacterized protein (DUF2147 family)
MQNTYTTMGAANTTAAQTTLVAKLRVAGREDWWRVKIHVSPNGVTYASRIKVDGTVSTRSTKVVPSQVFEIAGERSHKAARAVASILDDCAPDQRAAYAAMLGCFAASFGPEAKTTVERLGRVYMQEMSGSWQDWMDQATAGLNERSLVEVTRLPSGPRGHRIVAIKAAAGSWAMDNATLVRVDEIVRKHSAFSSFWDLLTAAGGYRPTIDVSDQERRYLANVYDREQAIRGDSRRAERYISPRRIAA